MSGFKIGQKLLLLLLAIALGPLLIVGVLLVLNAQSELKREAVAQQKLAASRAADRVDNFLGSKTNVLIFQSQTGAAHQFDIPNISLNLAAMVKQDRSIVRIALVDKDGMEQVVFNQQGLVTEHKDVSGSDAFKAVNFLAGKEYIGPVTYKSGKPHITIAVPLIRFNEGQDLTRLSTAEFGKYRSPDDIHGVLLAEADLSDLWNSVLSTKIGKEGYAYVVDDKGSLIAHPDAKFLAQKHDLSKVHEVEHCLEEADDVHVAPSEKGVPVLATCQQITRNSWGVIAQEPVASVFASVNNFYRIGIVILMAVATIVILCSIVFRRQLLVPIQLLSAGALRIGRGDLHYKIPVKSDDELGNLARSFNSMGGSLQALVRGLQEKNQSLSEERRKLASILESVSDGVIAVNRNMQIVSINAPAAGLINRAPTTLVGQDLLINFPMRYEDQAFTLDLQEPTISHFKNVLLPTKDKLFYLELVVVVIKDREATTDIAAIITVHDLTQGKELEAMKLDFVAMAAHELRTPLTVVRGYLNLINNDPDITKLSVMNLEYLQRALVGVSQLAGLINNILNVSRIERGTLGISILRVDVARLVSDIVEQHTVSAHLKRQEIKYEGPNQGVLVAADESAIIEVMNNLIVNAIKYTQELGRITVKLEKRGIYVRVEITDNGQGISEAVQGHLFTKFYRAESSLTSGNRGTGLGLYIAKSIIELHHGQIGVVSKLGEGSTFFFTLPLFDNSKHAAVAAKTKTMKGINGWFTKRTDS